MYKKTYFKRILTAMLVISVFFVNVASAAPATKDFTKLDDDLTKILNITSQTENYYNAVYDLEDKIDNLKLAGQVQGLEITDITDSSISLRWDVCAGAEAYNVYWSDKDTENSAYKKIATVEDTNYTFNRSTHVNYFFKVAAIIDGIESELSEAVKSSTKKDFLVQLEYLDRGLVAVPTQEGIFLSWRFLANEATGYSETGLVGANFNVYRDGQKIATVENSTNYLDKDGTETSAYYVCATIDGQEVDQSYSVTSWGTSYYDLPLKKPADGVTPSGEEYSYHANDMSVGDVDGDGQYEYFVKWDPSNSKDVSQVGYTGNVYIDCYKFDGTLLYRLDLGVNIRAGAHYTQFLVYDFDGDGKAELMLKTAPGTKIIKFDEGGNVISQEYITMPQEDIDAGYTHEDDYRMSNEDYYEHIVELFMKWHEHEEVLNGHWSETLEECFGIEKKYEYPLSREDAENLADHFMDVYAPNRSSNNKLREFEGFILSGPEYLTVFDGATGDELETIHYKPGRYDDGLMWGDYAMARIEPGNRVDRFLAGVAYLDGENPYAIFCRGYYTRTTLVAYRWDGEGLQEYWYVDSGWTIMQNPFNDNPHGIDGTDEGFGSITCQGAHSMSIADVDGDGCHEIIYGSATINNDGSLLYSSEDVLPKDSASPGTVAKLGHGDALHVADIDPDRPGLEIFMCYEGGPWAPYGYALRDAETGEVIYGEYTGRDTGRAMVGDVESDYRGLETWAVGLWTANGKKISDSAPGTNMNIKWSADMTTQIINGSRDEIPTIDDWEKGNLLTATGTRTNNWTKGNPCLVADIFGDWREELLLRTEDSSAIRIYLNTEVTDHKLYTLMHDVQYRVGIAGQNVCYNQPSYPSFYFASDTDWEYVPIPQYWEPSDETLNFDQLTESISKSEIKLSEIESDTYLSVTVEALRSALADANEILDTAKIQQQIDDALKNLEQAYDGLVKISDNYKFDFGHKNGTQEGWIGINSPVEFSEEILYGFVNLGELDFSKGDDASKTVEIEGVEHLRSDLYPDLYGMLYDAVTGADEFNVRVPNGKYKITLYHGLWTKTDIKFTINGTEYDTIYNMGEIESGGSTHKIEYIVTVDNGIINIKYEGTVQRLSGLAIEPYQETVETTNGILSLEGTKTRRLLSDSEIGDYNVWSMVEKLISKIKRRLVAAENLDVGLAKKMVTAKDTFLIAKEVDIVDFSIGENLIAQVEELDPTLYTQTSYNSLMESKANLESIMLELRNLDKLLDDAIDEFEIILANVDLEQLPDIIELYFDGGSETSPVAEGFIQLADTMLYTLERGYGMTFVCNNRERGGDPLYGDFVLGADIEFLVDLPNGKYNVVVISGDMEASNSGRLVINDEDKGSYNVSAGKFYEYNGNVEITDEQLSIKLVGGTVRLNGVIIEQIIPIADEEVGVVDKDKVSKTGDEGIAIYIYIILAILSIIIVMYLLLSRKKWNKQQG